MRSPLLLDLFCGAGGAAEGYRRAGFTVTGVDNRPQPHYPFGFLWDDAIRVLKNWTGDEGFDAIHASPPCQAYSVASQYTRNKGKQYPDLLGIVRDLMPVGIPWVIENVPGAPMRTDYKLCGCMFGLELRRERWFETSWGGFDLRPACSHDGPVPSITGTGTPSWVKAKLGYNPGMAELSDCMGIDWMNRAELSQAIPPAYTKYIGNQLMEHIGARV